MIFKDRSNTYFAFPFKKKVLDCIEEVINLVHITLCYEISVYICQRTNYYSREESCVCGKHCGLPGLTRIDVDLTKEFSHTWD